MNFGPQALVLLIALEIDSASERATLMICLSIRVCYLFLLIFPNTYLYEVNLALRVALAES